MVITYMAASANIIIDMFNVAQIMSIIAREMPKKNLKNKDNKLCGYVAATICPRPC